MKYVGRFLVLLSLGIVALSSCVSRLPEAVPTNYDVLVTVDLSAETAVPPAAIGGVNLANAMNIPAIAEYSALLNSPSVTWPAGNNGDMADLTASTLDFFRIQLRLLDFPHTFAQTRLFNGTPENAAFGVSYAIENNVPVDIWTIGNEPDLYADHRNAPEWDVDYFIAEFRAQVEAMRAVDPNVRISGPAVSQPKDDWIRRFIYEAGDLVDVLSWHWYPTNGTWDDADALATAADAEAMVERYRSWLRDPETNPKGYDRDIELALTEFALHWDTPVQRHLTDMVAALWTAEALGGLAKSTIDYSHLFCLHEYGGHSLFSPGHDPRNSYFVLANMRRMFSGGVVFEGQSSDALVHVISGRDEAKGRLNTVLLNKSPDDDKTVTLHFEGDAIPNARVVELAIQSDGGYVSEVAVDGGVIVVDPATTTEASGDVYRFGLDGHLEVSMPPYSIIYISLEG